MTICNTGSLAAGCISMIVAAGAWAQSWNARNEFSVSGNPNGVWSYGWMPVGFGTFTHYTNFSADPFAPSWYGWNGDHTPGIWRNLTGHWNNGVGPGELSLHPGPGTEPSILRWTAPSWLNKEVRIVGTFGAGDAGTISVMVRHGGNVIWSAVNAGSFDTTLLVPPGESLDFAAYNGYGWGSTPVDVTIAVLCSGDFNGDLIVDMFDYFDFIEAFSASEPAADFNADGVIDFFDYLDYVSVFAVGC